MNARHAGPGLGILSTVVEPAGSGRMLGAPWSASTADEGGARHESRAYLQTRLTVLFQLMFWCFAVLVLFLYGAYQKYPEIEPALNRWVYLGFTGGLAILAVMWRGLLVRNKQLTFRQLHAMDAFYAIATNTVIAACAVLSYDKRQAAYTCLLYAAFAVLTRALIVPLGGKTMRFQLSATSNAVRAASKPPRRPRAPAGPRGRGGRAKRRPP